jgi:hypothetical protein
LDLTLLVGQAGQNTSLAFLDVRLELLDDREQCVAAVAALCSCSAWTSWAGVQVRGVA